MSSPLHPQLEPAGYETVTLVGTDAGPIELTYGRDEAGRPKGGLRVTVHGCMAPDCPCREVQLEIELLAREGLELAPTGRRYELGVDVDTMEQRAIRMDAEHVDEKILAAFRRELHVGSSLHTELKERFARHRGDWGAPNPSFDYSEAEQGQMIRFAELFPQAQTTLLRDEDERYVFDDDWCPRPSCKCEAGLVHFYRLVDGEGAIDDSEDSRPAEYAGTANYPATVTEPLPPGLVPPSSAILALLEDAEVKHALETRRDAVRKAARAHFEAKTHRVAATKIGRNDPCPCGSGKKHKKCCQRTTA